MTARTVRLPEQRQAFAVVLDFAAAADRIAAMAQDWRQGQFRSSDTITAANTIAGMNVLLGELRANFTTEG